MKVLASILAVAMAMASVNGATLEPKKCNNNGEACFTYWFRFQCCSGYCHKINFLGLGECADPPAARAAEPEVVAETEARAATLEPKSFAGDCKLKGSDCNSSGKGGNCCSGFCLSTSSDGKGKCASKPSARAADLEVVEDTEARTAEVEVVAETEARAAALEPKANVEARCIPNNQHCFSSGYRGTCCSGFCLSTGGIFGYGKCTDRPAARAAEPEVAADPWADDGGFCLVRGRWCHPDSKNYPCCPGFYCYTEGDADIGICKQN